MAFYVVTGGAGFIGSHLTEALLAAGHRVRVLDDLSSGRRDQVPAAAELAVCDVAEFDQVAALMAGTDGCFHLAAVASVARSSTEWALCHRTNAGGTVSVLQAARDSGRLPVVLASSAAVYGDQGDQRLHEGLVPHPLSAYGADKFAGELHARIAFEVHGAPTSSLRFFNVYGPRQDPCSPYSGVISLFADRIRSRRAVTIHGDGQQTRDFIHVRDVVGSLMAAMERLISHPEAGLFNVCTGRATSVLGLAETLGEIAGWKPAISFAPPRPADIRHSLGSPSMARLAWRTPAPLSLAEGLADLLAQTPAPARAVG